MDRKEFAMPLLNLNPVKIMVVACLFLLAIPSPLWSAPKAPVRLFIVSSYHREYMWSQDTHQGVMAAFLEAGYFDNRQQIETFTQRDFIETSKMVLKKMWMDTKRKSATSQIAVSVEDIIQAINAFQPDLILLGDDNAANWIGNEYLDTPIPVVFWGVNGTPVKYGLLESREEPGHNITGVYQAGYLKESVELLQRIVPSVKTIAVISDDSATGRSKVREMRELQRRGELQVRVVEMVHTDDYQQWKDSLLRLQRMVDAFIILNHNSLKDAANRPVDQLEAGHWYLTHIQRPECSHEAQFVYEGLLCVTDDSGYKQGYEAVKIAIRILEKGENPATIVAYAPSRGKYMANRLRARQLGIQLTEAMGIEQFVETSKALEKK